MTETCCIVIPCYNEVDRLEAAEVLVLLAGATDLLFVNDGSTDTTAEHLRGIVAENPSRCALLDLEQNQGKAEAVRRGMLQASSQGYSVVGFLDADFATPASEMLRLVEILDTKLECQVLLASRWLHLGSQIEREPLRHYCGRIFATFASMILKLNVYDTQCGAKLFRNTEAFSSSLAIPFLSRWAFDVELIGRLRRVVAVSEFEEASLNVWRDKAGSKLNMFSMAQSMIDLLRIWRSLR